MRKKSKEMKENWEKKEYSMRQFVIILFYNDP